MLPIPVLAAGLLFLGPQDPRPYARVHDAEVRFGSAPASAPRSGPAGPATACSTIAAGTDGEPVPGGGTLSPNSIFDPGTIIGGNGGTARAAFVALIHGLPRNQGVVVHDGTTLTPIVIGCGGGGGSGVPGSGCGDPTPIGGTFSGFFTGTVFAPAVNDSGDVLFLADVDGGSAPRGLFLHQASTGSIVKVAAVGDSSPAGGAFAIVGPGSINDRCDAVFLASGSTAGNSDIFLWRNGVVTTIAKVGDPAPSGGTYQFLGSESFGFIDGTTIPAGPVPDINDQGIVVFRAVTSGGTRGHVRTDLGANPSWVITTGEPTPLGGTFFDFPSAACVNEAGEYAFFADFKPTPTTFSSGWFAGSPGNWHDGLSFFDPVGAGICFGLAFSRNPMSPLDDQGNLLLWTDVQLPGGNLREHLVVRSRDGALGIIARKGDATPIGGTYSGFDPWPSLDRHGRGAIAAFTPGASGGALNAHFLFELCPLASASARNGLSLNASCFAADPPVLGSTWTATVDASAHPGAGLTFIGGYARPFFGRTLVFGELLVDNRSSRLFTSLAASGGAVALHSHAIPNDPALAGLRTYLQAVILGGGPELCNAVDVVLGN